MNEHDDLFIKTINDGKAISGAAAERLQTALKTVFLFLETGGINWAHRQFAKKWYYPRRGRSGITSLLHDLELEERSLAYIIRSDQKSILVAKVGFIINSIFRLMKDGETLLIVATNGRWIIEFSLDQYLHFDYSIPDEKKFSGLYGACPIDYQNPN